MHVIFRELSSSFILVWVLKNHVERCVLTDHVELWVLTDHVELHVCVLTDHVELCVLTNHAKLHLLIEAILRLDVSCCQNIHVSFHHL